MEEEKWEGEGFSFGGFSYVHLLLNAINTITADATITMATIPTTSTVPITGFVTVLTAVAVGWMIEVAVMVTTLPLTVVSFTTVTILR